MAERKGLAVVDDEPEIQRMVQEHLDIQNLHHLILLQGFNSGESFIAFFRNHPSDINAVLMDGMLGRMNGVVAAKLARDIDPNLTIIGCTDHTKFQVGFARLGVNLIVPKSSLYSMLSCIVDLALSS